MPYGLLVNAMKQHLSVPVARTFNALLAVRITKWTCVFWCKAHITDIAEVALTKHSLTLDASNRGS